jgi:hypothetical protein
MTNILVTGTYSDGAGNPLSGTITFTPVVTGTDGTVVFLADPVSASVSGGVLSQALTTTDSWNVEGAVTYKVVERVGSTGRKRYYVTLPSSLGLDVDLATRVQFATPPNQIQLDSGGSTTDFTTHIATVHDPLDAELVALDGRIDALEATSGAGAHNSLTSRSAADGHPTSAITGLDAALAGKQPLDSDLTAFAALAPANDNILQRKSGAWVASTPATVATDMGVAASSTQALTNKSIDFDTDVTGNSATNIPYDAIPGLEADLATITAPGMRYIKYNTGTSSWPSRASSGTSDANDVVMWIGGTAPTIGGTGATNAVTGDLWLRVV